MAVVTVGAIGYYVYDKITDYIAYYKEHIKNARPSTKDKHEKGESRRPKRSRQGKRRCKKTLQKKLPKKVKDA